jgi:hypothetical protein
VVEQVLNLKISVTLFFFDTLHDLFREGADFVRGYPFSLWEGIPTAILQGAWTSSSAARYVDAVLTVLKLALDTTSGITCAFDWHLVGPLASVSTLNPCVRFGETQPLRVCAIFVAVLVW